MKSVAIPSVLVLPLSFAILSPGSLAQGSDSCSSAQGVVGPGPHAFDLTGASTGLEGQATPECNVFGDTTVPTDVWFTWSAPLSGGDFVLTTCQQTTVNTKVAIYPATGCPSGSAIWCDDDGCYTQSLLPFFATGGQSFLIQIGTAPFNPAGTGTFQVLPASSIDDCASPAPIAGTGLFGFNNNAAGLGTHGLSNPFCPPGMFSPTWIKADIWFSWTAPATGMAKLDTCGQTSTDTQVAAYSGTGCPPGSSLACDDDACQPMSEIQWPVTFGVPYTLQIGGMNSSTISAGTFRIDITPIPSNDSCASPDIANSGGNPYDNTTATTGTQGQGNPCGGIEKDLWWNWTASVNGTATIETCFTTAANTSIAIYTGGGCPAGTALACDDDGCGQQSQVSISVTAGATFRIQVGTPAGFPAGPAVFVITETALGGGPMTPMCFPGTGGVISCPCGQPANPSGGCANFGAGATSGAVLNATGTPSVSNDDIDLVTTNHRLPPPGGVLNVFFSYKPGPATPTTGTPSGAGVRCTATGGGGSLRRLYSAQAFGGSLTKPGMGDPSVSARSASFAGHAISPPETRFYFNVYRDGQASAPCGSTAVSTNLTNMGSIAWTP